MAPNNYTYMHSLTYTWDNYTNTGIEFTQALTKNWILQFGVTIGTEAPVWHWGSKLTDQYVATKNCAATVSFAAAPWPAPLACGQDPLYPGSTYAH